MSKLRFKSLTLGDLQLVIEHYKLILSSNPPSMYDGAPYTRFETEYWLALAEDEVAARLSKFYGGEYNPSVGGEIVKRELPE